MNWIWVINFLGIVLECDMPIMEAIWILCAKDNTLLRQIMDILDVSLRLKGYDQIFRKQKVITYQGNEIHRGQRKTVAFSFQDFVVRVRPHGDPAFTIFGFKWLDNGPMFHVYYPPETIYIPPRQRTTRILLSNRIFPTQNMRMWLDEIEEIAYSNRSEWKSGNMSIHRTAIKFVPYYSSSQLSAIEKLSTNCSNINPVVQKVNGFVILVPRNHVDKHSGVNSQSPA